MPKKRGGSPPGAARAGKKALGKGKLSIASVKLPGMDGSSHLEHHSDKRKRWELAAARRASAKRGHKDVDMEVLCEQLGKLGACVREIVPDGNCLFRAVSDQMSGQEEEHAELRTRVCNYMADKTDDYAPFMLEEDGFSSFEDYVSHMRGAGEWGGNLELQALSTMLGVNVVVHQAAQPPWVLRTNPHPRARAIHLSYHDGNHYNSVRRLDDVGRAPARPLDADSVFASEVGAPSAAAADARTAAATHDALDSACAEEGVEEMADLARGVHVISVSTPPSPSERRASASPRDSVSSGSCNNKSSKPESVRASTRAKAGEPPRRNGPCPCGSGAVYRRCCLRADVAAAAAARKKDAPLVTDEAGEGGADSGTAGRSHIHI